MRVIPASIASFLVSSTMLLVLRPLAEAVGLVDKPGGHKTHHGEVPVVGGIAMFAGLLVTAVGGAGLARGGLSMLTAAAFMVVIGALDDRFNLPPRVRLFAHMSAAVAVVYSTGYQVHDLGDLAGFGVISLGPLALPFTIVAMVALINAFNMLDGLDGLAGSTGLVAFGGMMVLASRGGNPGTLVISGAMFGAVAAFLLFNLPVHVNRSVRTFMGDAGSTLLGFLLAALALRQTQKQLMHLTPMVVVWLMPIPIFELFSSTARRLAGGVSLVRADNGHFHHVLIKAGLSVRAICALYFLTSLAGCCFGVWAYQADLPEPLMFAVFCVAFGAWLLFVVNARRIAALLPVWLLRTGNMA
ncbi:MAG TPA: MraY family glycosyltransferase [Steroidobacteraceae bacterium]|nr:MraY family glycosyltransferase [Steroidobacteraceae bacterium]